MPNQASARKRTPRRESPTRAKEPKARAASPSVAGLRRRCGGRRRPRSGKGRTRRRDPRGASDRRPRARGFRHSVPAKKRPWTAAQLAGSLRPAPRDPNGLGRRPERPTQTRRPQTRPRDTLVAARSWGAIATVAAFGAAVDGRMGLEAYSVGRLSSSSLAPKPSSTRPTRFEKSLAGFRRDQAMASSPFNGLLERRARNAAVF